MNASEGLRRIATAIRWGGAGCGVLIIVGAVVGVAYSTWETHSDWQSELPRPPPGFVLDTIPPKSGFDLSTAKPVLSESEAKELEYLRLEKRKYMASKPVPPPGLVDYADEILGGDVPQDTIPTPSEFWTNQAREKGLILLVCIVAAVLVAGGARLLAWIIDGFAEPRRQ